MTYSSAELAEMAVELIAKGIGVYVFTPADRVGVRLEDRPEPHWVLFSKYFRVEAPNISVHPAPDPEEHDAVLEIRLEGCPASVKVPYRHIDRIEAQRATERPNNATIVRTFTGVRP